MTDALEPAEPELLPELSPFSFEQLPDEWRDAPAARALAALRQGIADMDAERAELAEEGDTESLLVGLSALQVLVRDLRTLAGQVETDASRLMGEQGRRSIAIDHVGLFERKRSTVRKNWQHADLAKAVLDRAWDAGDITHPADVVAELAACAGFSYWRVGALKARGFEPDEWCEADDAHWSIKVTGAER